MGKNYGLVPHKWSYVSIQPHKTTRENVDEVPGSEVGWTVLQLKSELTEWT